MGKTGRWIKSLFTGKKDSKVEAPPPCNGKEKRRWSFRGSAMYRQERGASMDLSSMENDAKKLADLAVATADAAVAAAKAAAAVIQFTNSTNRDLEEPAAVKIQSVFRAYLARKALNALRGLVKLQALVRGHLVRKQAAATLRCMQALITVQARARAHRLQMAAVTEKKQNPRKFKSQDYLEENIKIVEMDSGAGTRARNSYSNHRTPIKQGSNQISPAPSARTVSSPRTSSNHFEEYSFGTVQSSPQCYSAMSKPDMRKLPFSYARSEYGDLRCHDFSFYPNYMSNTESSRAKVRSHSAPKSRPAETFERQGSRRRASLEGRNVPKAVRMQRSSSSQVSSTTLNYQYPNLEKPAASLKEHVPGLSTTYKSLVGSEVQGARF